MPKRQEKFREDMYVTAYELARDGLSDTQIAKTIGVAWITFRGWMERHPALVDAVERGRKRRTPGDEFTFHDYIFQHLSPDLRPLWEEITRCEDEENQMERVEALLANRGTRVRQHLFIHALTKSCFNVSRSLRMLCIPRKMYENWRQNDPDFIALVDEIHWHKENFFESAFIGRVAAGDTTAIIHAAKTKLRHRGYNDKVEIEVSGTVTHEHLIDINTLDLDMGTRRAILEALRARKEAPPAIPYAQVVGN